MQPHDAVARLEERMPAPTHSRGRQTVPPPWEEAPAVLGYQLPVDYRLMISRFGGGLIGGEFLVYAPMQPRGRDTVGQWEASGGFTGFAATMKKATALAVEEIQAASDTFPFDAEVKLWGCNLEEDAAAYCFWDCDGDPDRWQVLAYLRRTHRWYRYPGGMVEFLLAAMDGAQNAEGVLTNEAAHDPYFLQTRHWEGQCGGAAV